MRSWGKYDATPTLASITIVGLQNQPRKVNLKIGWRAYRELGVERTDGVLKLDGLDCRADTSNWEDHLELTLS